MSYADNLQIKIPDSTNNIRNIKHIAEDHLYNFLKIQEGFSMNSNGANIFPLKQITKPRCNTRNTRPKSAF